MGFACVSAPAITEGEVERRTHERTREDGAAGKDQKIVLLFPLGWAGLRRRISFNQWAFCGDGRASPLYGMEREDALWEGASMGRR